jgi:hypothetical protein
VRLLKEIFFRWINGRGEHYRKNYLKNLHPTCNPILKFGIL